MFRVADDFDFDDDILDISTENEINSRLEVNFSSQELKSKKPLLPSTTLNSEFIRNGLKRTDVEFFKPWEAENENFQRPLNNSFSFLPNSEVSTRHVKKTVRSRKFPGPAGLLPERQGNTSLVATKEFLEELNAENQESPIFQEHEVLSQSSGRVFEFGAWSAMMEDIGASGRALTSLMNLASLRLKNARGYKVPFLAVIINNIDCTLPDPTVIVKDVTDEMHGMLHREVWEKFNGEMVPGSVLVLKNVGVINAGTTSRRHVLNITANNLTAIYSTKQDEQIQIRKISELPVGDNSNMLHEWEKIGLASKEPEKIKEIRPLSRKPNVEPLRTIHRNSYASTSLTSGVKPFQMHSKKEKGQSKLTTQLSFEHISKKRKNMTISDMISKKSQVKDQASLLSTKSTPFQIDTDSSLVDSLLDGIDTNSLFEEF